jgi:hypothetical protein
MSQRIPLVRLAPDRDLGRLLERAAGAVSHFQLRDA